METRLGHLRIKKGISVRAKDTAEKSVEEESNWSSSLDGVGPQSVVGLSEMLAKEDPDYIDEEENDALDATLATQDVDAVIAFSATLPTPMRQRPLPAATVGLDTIQEDNLE